ncbi:10899_t:CDS:10 [Ambispora gerdemannii]|uniref:Ribosome assembly protein 1 n=1 Tax=Ambispora gerdemannii TaxID=144530 RepID=A0A9N8YKV1_9GLOM|nr:10899_t:CDS:10 [Ambispora gerdemannii]
MPVVTSSQLAKLQSRPENIRNICILAHVDHGKTTLSDSLLASNGIISNKLAGKVRYLDSREDEQERGITMEASGISLYFQVLRKAEEVGAETVTNSHEYLINLIDSPGHIDFSSEVSTASRLCDGALILVDAVEGICSQTHTVLRQAWIENVRPVLVLNKLDRLITELKLTPMEAYIHLNKILEQVNAIVGTFFAGDVLEEETRRHDAEKERLLREGEISEIEKSISEASLDDRDDSSIYFTPESGNVIFSSAIDGWGFRVEQFADIYASKLNIKVNLLRKILWGDYYLDPKTKRILQNKHLKGRHLKPMFVQFVLDNIWTIYDAVILNNNREKIEKIVKTLNLKILPRDMRSKDTRTLLTSMFSQWLPLSTTEFNRIVENEQPKFEAINETFIGFARLYSGTIRVGQKLFALKPKYDPIYPENYCTEFTVQSLYMLMGRELESLQEVPAGNVFGIGGLEGHILKNGTLSSTKSCKTLAGVALESAPIVRVALEPTEPSEMSKLIEGLHLLNQADPCVEILVQETGEHVILTAGEVHLERCLKDLKDRFAKIEIQVSPPIVPFRETIVHSPETHSVKDKDPNILHGLITLSTTNKYCTLKVRTVPLPSNVTSFLNENAITVKAMLEERQWRNKADILSGEEDEEALKEVAIKKERVLQAEEFFELLEAEFEKAPDKDIWKDVVENIWAFGPKRVGPNLLINRVSNYTRKSWRGTLIDSKLSNTLISTQDDSLEIPAENKNTTSEQLTIRDFEEAVHTGFQLATKAGPLCAEPLMGVAYFVEDFLIDTENTGLEPSEVRSKIGGQVMTTMRDACRQGFLEWSPRLMLAMYSCDIQATTEVLGRVYGVISRRRGRITSEELKEGTPFFEVHALMPVIESFGFADEIRKRTSGAASPQLIFSGFEMLDEDPFWVPTTEEELEDLGEKSDRENLAKKYMEKVRKRKGMFVEKKIVEHAEKQRTIKKR